MITVNLSAIKRTTFREYAIRFFFGGACTAIAGLIAKHFGPELGGLFLAFPAIFPASACLIESSRTPEKSRRRNGWGRPRPCRRQPRRSRSVRRRYRAR